MVEMIDPNELTPHPLNARIYGSDVDETFVEKVKKNGIIAPLLVTEGKVVVSGHRRRHAAIAIGMPEVPCIILKGVDARDAERRLVLANDTRIKTTEMRTRELAILHEIEAERAAARQKAGGKVEGNGRAFDIAASKVGMSPGTARKAVNVVAEIDKAEQSGDEEKATRLREKLEQSVCAAAREIESEPEVSEEHKRAIAAGKSYDVLANHLQFLRNRVDHEAADSQFREVDAGLQKVHGGIEWVKRITRNP